MYRNKKEKQCGKEIVMSAPLYVTFVAQLRIFNRRNTQCDSYWIPFLRWDITPTFNLAEYVASSVRLIGRNGNRGERCKKTRYRAIAERNRII